ncbi:hypothetical protein [Tranquillimonas alkanivorans]|nr:hypothetical protein [Tranquillimonas alkanivorans]
MSATDCFAYFLEEHELRDVLRDWPARMSLALCLDDSGTCELVVFHEDESDRILERVGEVLQRPLGAFAVAPEVEGYPTRRILFSEERQLLTLVAETDRLSEIASDYAINFNFAREEGLDPTDLTRLADRREGAEWEAPSISGVSTGGGPAAAGSGGLGHLPPGYVRADRDTRPECDFVPGRLSLHGGRVRVTLEPALADEDRVPTLVHDVAFREDFARFVLPRDALGAAWQAGGPAVLDVPAELFPQALIMQFARRPRAANVTVTPQAVFVTPTRAVETSEPEARTVLRSQRRRKIVTPFRLAAVALAALGLAGGEWVARHDVISERAPQVARQVQPGAAQDLVLSSLLEQSNGQGRLR